MLIVVEDGDVELLAEPCLDREAAGRGDVLEVDPAESRRDRLADRDDLVRVFRVETDRPGVDATELLEEHCLSLHDRHRRLGADVAEAEHRRPVRDHGDRVLLDGEIPRGRGIVGDCLRDACDAGRVGHREVIARLERDLRLHLDLPTEVHEEGAIGDTENVDPVEGADCVRDGVEVLLVRCRDGDVAHLVVRLDAHDVDCAERAPGLPDRLGDPCERPGCILQSQPQSRAERW